MLNNLHRIWERFINDDEEALVVLYKEYANKMYSYGMKIIQDEELVKDSIQEVFISLIDNRKRLILTSQIQFYLFKSLRNKLYEELRSKYKKDLHKIRAFEEQPFTESSHESIIIEDELQEDKKLKLKKAMEHLSDRQKEVLYLRFTEELDYPDIANILSIDIASARTLVYRSLKTLRKTIDSFIKDK